VLDELLLILALWNWGFGSGALDVVTVMCAAVPMLYWMLYQRLCYQDGVFASQLLSCAECCVVPSSLVASGRGWNQCLQQAGVWLVVPLVLRVWIERELFASQLLICARCFSSLVISGGFGTSACNRQVCGWWCLCCTKCFVLIRSYVRGSV
jgi:hypothetical protein